MPSILMLLSKPFAGDIRVNREARSLAESGFIVSVVAWNRETGKKESHQAPGSIGVFLTGPKCLTRNFLSFIANLPCFWVSAFLAGIKGDKIVVVHAHDFDTLPLGYLISKLKGAKLVYDAHESYADMVANDSPNLLIGMIRRLEKFFIRRANLVIVANENVGKLIGAESYLQILSCPSRSEIPLENRSVSSCRTSDLLRLAYFGTLEPGRFVNESAHSISRSNKWCMVIGGIGTLGQDIAALASKSKNIIYMGSVPHEEVMRQTAASDAVHVILEPSNVNYRIATPLRLLEAMALGISSIATKGTFAAEIIQAEDCGFLVDPTEESIDRLLEDLSKIPSEMRKKGQNGKTAFQREYNWERQYAKLIYAYQKLLGN